MRYFLPSPIVTFPSRMHARAAFSKATSAFNTVRRLSNSSNSGNRIASFLTKHPPSSSSSSFTNHTKTKTTQSTIVKTMATSSDDAGLVGDVFFLDEFAMRQWDDPAYGGTRINFDKAEFVKRIHEAHAGGAGLVDGYAPFCKHVFVPNFIAGTKVGAIPITEENQHLLRSGYSARSDAEATAAAASVGCFSWYFDRRLPPSPYDACFARSEAVHIPVLSAQFNTAATGRPRDILNLAPVFAVPRRPAHGEEMRDL